MNDNYAVINGKRIKLTDEQVEMLGVEKRKNPFERVDKDENYYFITSRGAVLNYVYINDMTDRELYHSINYFNDKQFAEHDDEYLLCNYYNLLEKYRRGQKDFSEEEFERLTDFVKKSLDKTNKREVLI